MIQKIAFGILAFALAIAAVTVVAGNVLSYGWKESLPDVGWAAAIALAYALLARLLARGLFFRIRPTVRNVLSLALQGAVSVAVYVKLFDFTGLPAYMEHPALFGCLFPFFAAHAFACFFLLLFRTVGLLTER